MSCLTFSVVMILNGQSVSTDPNIETVVLCRKLSIVNECDQVFDHMGHGERSTLAFSRPILS